MTVKTQTARMVFLVIWQTHCSSPPTKQTDLDCEAAGIYTHDHHLALLYLVQKRIIMFRSDFADGERPIVVIEGSEYWKE